MLGEKLRLLRTQQGLTQEEVGRAVGGFKKPAVSQWESGDRTPDAATIKKLAIFFDVSTDYLLSLSDNPKPVPNKSIQVKDQSGVYAINKALSENPKLKSLWGDLVKRDDLQAMMKQAKALPPEAVRRIIKYIEIVENE